jgi:hypothetical protein
LGQINPQNRTFLEKLTVAQLATKWLTLYGTQIRAITIFTRGRDWLLITS